MLRKRPSVRGGGRNQRLHKGAELFLAIAILALWSSNESLAADNNQRVVCYYTNWSVYRPGTAKFTPQNINPYLCTHLIYSFGGFTKENTLKPYDKYQDIEQGGFAKFTGLKTYNKNLKTLLAIGGWNEGSSRFSPLVADAERRNQFVKNTIKFLRQNHFDGLDLDWEYPAFRDGSKPKDRENYAQLVQELREEFEREASKTGRPRLLLTMAVPAGIEYVEKGYDVPKLNKYLDWFNLLSYDYHSAYEPAVNHHSPLFSLEEASEYNFDSELNIVSSLAHYLTAKVGVLYFICVFVFAAILTPLLQDYSVKFYLKAGADRDKLVLGIPTYGRSYTLYNPDATDIGAPADGPGEQGDATREKGYLAYYEICSSLKDSTDWTVVQPNPKAMGPYAYKGNQWVGYDDEAIARRKAKYVAENGLGGIMFWSIDNDDFRGTCHGKPYPIIEAAKEALLASTEVGINDVASSGRPRKPNRSRSRPGSATRNRVNTDNNNEIKASFKTSQGRKVARPARVTTTSTTTTTTTEDSLYIGGRTTTPQPPTTPDPGADFKCEDEGFFPHPRDCKKYFWCLDSPSLGLVAHQFTCPSGLVFNKLADSCDYARNVICSKTVATSTSTTSTTSTTTTVATPTTSTTQRPRISVPTNRNNFFNRGTFTTTTTTEPTVEVDYSDEDNTETQPEEDPKVIKELIALIKKVGGIEELEKQLQAQEDGSILLKDAESDPISTTAPTISKSLYERVLSRTGNVGQKFRPAITFTQQDKTGSLPENKYSSVVRNSYTNSRVGPQNEGLDQLPEFEGVFREKPKYVTLQRVRPTKATSIEDRYDDDEDIDEEENQPSTFATNKPTSVPKYVSIRRQRPTTVAEQDSEVEGDDAAQDEDREPEKSSAAGAQYNTVNRNWFRKPTEASNVAESEPERSSPNRAASAPHGDSAAELSGVDYQPNPEVTDTTVPIVSTLHKTDDGITSAGAKASLGETTLEVTTILNTGESVTGSSVSSLNAGLEGDSDTFANNEKRFEPLYDGGENGFTDYEPIITTTTTSTSTITTSTTAGVPSVSTTTVPPATASSFTNDATSNSVFKFTRTRKPSTTTATLEPVTNPSRKVPPGSGVAPIKAAPRPFAAGARRTRPTRLPDTANSLATTTAPEQESTTLRSVKVSFSNAQRFDLSAGRQRRVGSATPESSEVVDARQINEQSVTRATVRGNRGRVRFRTAPESLVASTPLAYTEPQSTRSADRFVSTTTPQTTRRRSRPSTGELAANRFAIGRTTSTERATNAPTTAELLTTVADRGSLRRVNFSLYSGRRTSDTVSTSATEEPRIETEAYDNVTPFEQADIKSYTRIAEDPFMTQERILLTLGTALRYGFSSRNELTSGTPSPTFPTQPVQEFSSTLAPSSRSTFRGRPFGRENLDNVVNNGLAENLNDMSTEQGTPAFNEDTVAPDSRLLNELTTVYNVNAAEVDTTTPQPRKLVSSSLRDRYTASTTTEAVDTTLNVVVSEVNTNKTFIPGRTRPTRPARLRTTLDTSTGSTVSEQEPTRAPSRRPFLPRKQPNTDGSIGSRFSPTDEPLGNDVTERGTGISTTKRQRANRRRTTTTTTTAPATATTAADESPVSRSRGAFNTEQRRQRLPANRFLKTASTTTSTESYTAEPTFPDSNVANSDFTTVITDTSNEIAPGYDLLNSDNLLNLPNLRSDEDLDEEDATETLSTLAVAVTEANPSSNLVSAGQTQQTKPSYTGQKPADSQQIESESIPSRSSTRVFGGGVTRRKFTGKFVTTEAPEPTEPIKKFVPTRRNRPSFSLARNGRLSTTTEESFVATTADTDSGVVSAGPAPFVPSRKRKPLVLGGRTSTTTAPSSENANGDDTAQPSARPTRRRPAYSLNRPARPQAFENSFDKATVTSKPVEQKSINRTSVLLPKRPNLFARTTTTTSTTTVTPLGSDATDRTTLDDRFTSSEEQRYSGEENEGDNEIQRQGKRLFGQLGNDASNSLVPQAEVETEKPRPETAYAGVRRPGSRVGPTPARVQPNAGGNRFIFKNNQPATGTGNGEGSGSSTTQRTFTTRTRRPFGNVGGYKPTAQNGTALSGDSGAPVAGSVTTPRPRFTPTTRTRPTFGRLRSTTASLANKPDIGLEGERAQVQISTLNDLEQGAGFATRRYQPRKPTSRRNFTSVSVPVTAVGGSGLYNGTRAGQNVTLPAVYLLTTKDTAEGVAQTTPQTNKETTLTVAEFPTDDTKQPHAFTVATIASQNGTDELTPTTTTSPWLLETVSEAENTTSYEDTVNTFRTTTEYYTASDETHYTTLNTADTIYTINDNIDIDDVNVLQDRSRTSTTTVKPTTLYHVFSIDKENESVPSSTEIYRTEEQEIELPAANRTDKLVKIHRVVEIYTKNTSNPDELPVMQKLGEINRKIIIRLVEPNRANNRSGSASSTSSSSYTPTTLGSGAPVTERVLDDEDTDGGRGRTVVLSSNSVFTVETSTIPLEGLFDPEKGGAGFPTTDMPPQVDTEQDTATVAPHQEIERISSLDFSSATGASPLEQDDELPAVTQLAAETDRYVQVTSLRPDQTDDTETEQVSDDRQKGNAFKPQTTDYYGPGDEATTTATVVNESEDTTVRSVTASTTRTTPVVSSSTQREIVHKYTLPAEFSFQEPSLETTTTQTTTTTTTTTTPATTTASSSSAPELLTTTASDLPSDSSTVVDRVQSSLVLPSKESKRKYTKRPDTVLTASRVSDFAYSRDSSAEADNERVTATTEQQYMTEPVPITTTKATNTRHYTNNRKYVSSLSLRPNFSTPDAAQTGGPSYRKSKDIPVVPLPKVISSKSSTYRVPTTSDTTTTTTRTTTTTTTTTTPAPITKIDFNIKYVLPVNLPDANSPELKIESKNDKYSIPLSPILRPDFITREISGERQDRQFSPVYRPELDNDELTRSLTSDADPVALEAEHLDREILGNGDGRQSAESGTPLGSGTAEQLVSHSIPSSAAYFLRRTAEKMCVTPLQLLPSD
uniref:Uncharacterized protein n=1 Tax=Anopheles culicifacies TaxID=139723 RepID=A0A182MSG5_9DIPT